jgi:Ca2+-binding EF-hand superfamily protein
LPGAAKADYARRTMKDLRLVLRLGSGVLVLVLLLLPPVLRAEDAAAKAKTADEEKLKQTVAKHDANGDGQLDDSEKARMKADEAARAEKYKQALAKYDANHNGKLDPEELAKMKEDEIIAAKVERQQNRSDVHDARKLQKAQERGQGKNRRF